MNGFARIAWREVRMAWTGGGLWLPIVFYLAVATLFPFVTGPDKALYISDTATGRNHGRGERGTRRRRLTAGRQRR